MEPTIVKAAPKLKALLLFQWSEDKQGERLSEWLALALLMLLLAALVVRTLGAIQKIEEWSTIPTYSRVDYWIKSSECTVQTGVILSVCTPQGISGIEDHSLADDRGHTLLANLYSLLTGKVIDRKGLTTANVLLNATSFTALALGFYAYGWKLASLVLLLLGVRHAIPGPHPGPDAPAAYIAAFNFAMIAVLWAVHVPIGSHGRCIVRFLVGLGIATFCLTCATLIRQPYGIGGFVVAALVFSARMWSEMKSQAGTPASLAVPARILICLTCLGIATFYSTSAFIAMRSAAFGVARGAAVLHHGIGHNLYIGLGVKGNPWAIEWSDDYAYKAANKISDVAYASEGHFKNLWRLYFQTVLSDPVEVLKIYGNKLGASLDIVASRAKAWALFILLGLLAFLYRYLKRDWVLAALAVWGAFSMVIFQGVLAMPSSYFISPGTVAFLCGIALLADVAGRAMQQKFYSKKSE